MAVPAKKALEQFSISVPKQNPEKSTSIMKFSGVGIDITGWNEVKLEREDNQKVYQEQNGEPQFGAGSQYGRKSRNEARIKKKGYSISKYALDNQPWLLTEDSSNTKGRRFKGIREGGAGEHSDYWVFIKTAAGRFEAVKVDNWYQFMPLARYKTLDIDEAEEKFNMRNKVMNQFALKAQILKEGEEEEDVKPGTSDSKQQNKSFKISDRDEFPSDSDSDGEGIKKEPKDGDEGKPKKKKGGKKGKKNKADKKEADEEDEGPAALESDDGDEEGQEVDYMSDSGSGSDRHDEPEDKAEKELQGVDGEKGLRTLLSDNEEEDENEEETKNEAMDGTKIIKRESGDSDSGSDTDDPDTAVKSALFLPDKKGGSSSGKRAAPSDESGGPSKKIKLERDPEGKITENGVRYYLSRKPMSTKELLAKFKPKDKEMTKKVKEVMVRQLADILKSINPVQNKRGGVLYFSLKN